MVNLMKTTIDLDIGQRVKIVKHATSPEDPDTHLSNYPGFEVGTVHKVCDKSDPTGESVMVGEWPRALVVEAEEIEICTD